MKISCNDCRRQLGEMFENQNANDATASAQPQAPAEVEQHLAECPACRSELALLTAAREEMRAFPVLAAPTDLRSRIREQLEAEPTQATAATAAPENAATAATTIPATITADPFQSARKSATAAHEWDTPEPGKFQVWTESFRTFLRHPSNVAWMSCAVIILFYVVTLSLPKKAPAPIADSSGPSLLSQYQEPKTNEDEDQEPKFVAPPLKLPNLAARPGAKTPASPPADPSIPANMKPPSLLTPFHDAPLPITKGAPAEPKGELPNEPKGELPNAASAPFIAKLPESSTATPPSGAPRTKSEATPAPNSKSGGARTNSKTFAMRPPVAESDEPAAARSRLNAGPAGSSGPSGPPAAMAAPMMRRAESDAADSEASGAARSGNALAVREVNTRITPPRRVAFGQVSVNLPEGARFSDGTRARVIWRGSAEANEPIDLSFTIQAMPGQQTVKITLQEVRNNDAQMVAFKSLQIGGDR